MQYPYSAARRIIKEVAATYNVNVSDILGDSRKQPLVMPRQIAMYLAHDITGLSLVEIGKVFNRDHTTVIYAREKIDGMAKADENFYQEISALSEKIYAMLADATFIAEMEQAFKVLLPTDVTVTVQQNRYEAVQAILHSPRATPYVEKRIGLAEDRNAVAWQMAGRVNYAA